MDEAMQSLNEWVFDEGKFVTAAYVLRHTSLDVRMVQTLLTEFLESNRTDERINATYYLLGEFAPRCGQEEDIITRKGSIICRNQDLDKAKTKFLSLQVCNIHSVQAKPLRSLQVLQNIDWDDRNCVTVEQGRVHEKTLIRHPQALKAFNQWKESKGESETWLQDKMNRKCFNDKLGVKQSKTKNAAVLPTQTLNDDDIENGQDDDDSSKEKYASAPHEDHSPIKRSTTKSAMSQSSPHSQTSSPKRKRPKRIVIEEDEDEQTDDDNKSITLDGMAEESSGPLPTEDRPLSKQLKRPPSTSKSFRQEKIQETYMDEDGMEVTRTVPRLVETDEIPMPPVKRPTARKIDEAVQKPTGVKVKKSATGKTSQNGNAQMKISSFFGKK